MSKMMIKSFIFVIFFIFLQLSIGEEKVNAKLPNNSASHNVTTEPTDAKEEISIAMEGQIKPVKIKNDKQNNGHLKTVKSKIVARKGTDAATYNDTETKDLQIKSSTPVMESVDKSKSLVGTDVNIRNATEIKNDSTKKSISRVENMNKNKTLVNNVISSTTVKVEIVKPVTELSFTNIDILKEKPVRKAKHKPLVTIGGNEADEPIPASPTKTSPLGMPRKIDYIVPVVITITALPLLGITFYVLYKRGRDYWDKRHYRRMDFLIDGMYNE
ncbi:hypothetical protein TKK_0012874 [Trichogramma kaykai]|uniref:Uncharacterized protein n=1 Tax=Trichogramma kaykai TaxID=54128 RepID=A0ABD2WLQ6_9HYME